MKYLLTILLATCCISSYGQLIGFGGQYSEKADGQFAFNIAHPTYIDDNALNVFILSGLEYTTPGASKLSGLHLKPIQLSTYFSEYMFNNAPVTFTMGVDMGWLFDFRGNHKSSLIVTPNLYLDYKMLFLKAGYDIDTLHGNHQFFIRAGIGFTFGFVKNISIKY